MSEREVYTQLLDCLAQGRPVATVTIVAATGSIPNQIGAKMLVGLDGMRLAGTIGGGEIERTGLIEAQEALREGRSRSASYRLTEKDAHGIGMMCGGSAQLFVDVHLLPTRLVLVGGGHVHLEVSRMAQLLGWRVVLIEDRAEWSGAELYPHAERIQARPAAGLAQVAWEPQDYLVIATADADTESLRAAIKAPCHYVGLVASKRKTVQILKNLAAEGHELTGLMDRLHAPVGLDLGGKSPAELALSIVSEIQAHHHRRPGAPLSFVEEARAQLAPAHP